jgi:alkanesulfonate monooxygenase SsuD/methylene tetrahydromethanopterin reductase-like flavin-dependent oxidoreductase (luciferase family)
LLPLRGTGNEFQYYNVNPEETRPRTEEATLLIKKALSEPEPFAWKSEHFDFPLISVWPGATQIPHPPIYYSANSEESAVFAANNQLGAAISYSGPKLVAQRMAFYREQCDANGWTPTPEQTMFRAFCVVGEDEAHGQDLKDRFDPTPPNPRLAAQANIDKGFAFGMLHFAGSSEQVAEQIREHHEMTGVGIYDLSFNTGYYSFQETADQIRRFAREVAPRLRQLGAVPA